MDITWEVNLRISGTQRIFFAFITHFIAADSEIFLSQFSPLLPQAISIKCILIFRVLR
jgi:hypothetical protein